MTLEQTVEKMSLMKMHKMAESFKERIEREDHQSLSNQEFIGFLIDDEYQSRTNKKLESRLRQAQFKDGSASIESIDYKFQRGLKKQKVLELAQNKWIKNHQNILITGPSGVGKSYLAQALGNNACRNNYTVYYIRLAKLLLQLSTSKVDGTYGAKTKKISKANVLIIDDWGLSALNDENRQDLFEVIEDRYGVGSTVLTAQLPTKSWHEYLGGGMLGDGICDRILHNSVKLDLQGKSYRAKGEKLTDDGTHVRNIN